MNATTPTTQARKRYLREVFLATVLYLIVLQASVYALNHGVTGFLKYVVAFVPAIPVVGIFAAIVRWLRAADEYQRQTTITGMAIAGGATALITVTYGFLENAGLPPMSVWISWLIFMSIWGIATPILQRQAR
jgi:hypothetical protein